MQSPTVVIVEDDILVALMLQDTITEAGFGVIDICRSGEAAIDVVQRQSPDLLLLDVYLQGRCSGLEVARAVRVFWLGPIVFHTCAADAGPREQMAAIANAEIVFKPAHAGELIRVMRQMLKS